MKWLNQHLRQSFPMTTSQWFFTSFKATLQSNFRATHSYKNDLGFSTTAHERSTHSNRKRPSTFKTALKKIPHLLVWRHLILCLDTAASSVLLVVCVSPRTSLILLFTLSQTGERDFFQANFISWICVTWVFYGACENLMMFKILFF